MLENLVFEDPQYFWLMLLLPVVIGWYLWKSKRQTAELRISSTKGFRGNSGLLARLRPVLLFLRLLVLALVITGLARPRAVDISSRTSTTRGIDIVIAMDISSSMLARDLDPNRLEATKEVAAEFIRNRPGDRIGLVVYAGESYTKTPITSDKSIVLSSLQDISYNQFLENGTAIGMGLATAVNRLKDSKAESKVIILLTDGMNNAGFIDPKIASELAVEFGIKVYTIGVGSDGMALSPVSILPNGNFQYGMVPVEIDEELLTEIAQVTGGLYFRANNNEKLEEIYEEIDRLEKTEIEEFEYYNYQERYRPLILTAFFLFFLEILLRFTVFRSFI